MNISKQNNPGGNVKGQASRAKVHHTGPTSNEYIRDPVARSQAVHKRKPTIIKKIKELHKKTKTEMLFKWRTESGQVGCFTTDGWFSGHCNHIENDTSVETAEQTMPQERTTEPTEDVVLMYPQPPQPVEDTATAAPSNCKISDIDLCRVCGKTEINKKGVHIWFNCETRKCKYWVHSVCANIVLKPKANIDDVKYYCPEHIKQFKI